MRIFRGDDVVLAARWKVQIEQPIVFDQVGGPDGANVLMEGIGNRLPVGQVGGVPNRQTGIGPVRTVRDVEVFAITNDRWVGMIAAQNHV